jgi:dTDP-4-amino-4,6-dideoxygalactose transaminase
VPNPVLFIGAKPIYADIDPLTLNITAESVARVLSPRTRAIVAQHTFGLPAPMASLALLARQRGIPLIEDCTHALGATIDCEMVGTLGDAAFFSFEQTKVVSAGAGGVTFSRDGNLGSRIAAFQSRCVAPAVRDARQIMSYLAYSLLFRDPRWASRFPHAGYYLSRLRLMAGPETTAAEMVCERPPGFSKRWSGAQARVGLSQLRQLSVNLRSRRSTAAVYAAGLAGSRVGLFHPEPSAVPSFVRYPVRVRDKPGLAADLRRVGIQLGMWFTAPVHPEGVPQARAGYLVGSCPHAEAAVADVVNLPCHPRMNAEDAQRVIEAVLASSHA